MSAKHAYIITGPTASGKSDVAHELAKKIRGTIINCDSVQIYRGIENISASPFAEREISDEIDGVPYRLFSVLSLSEQISVADYINLAKREYDSAIASGRTPIFVGGTGYYINGIINGIAAIPEISRTNREKARNLVADNLEAARAMVPDCLAVDPQRVSRALEVLFETGKSITWWQHQERQGAIVPTPFRILINPPLDVLHKRIASRIPKMISGGALNEARYVIENNFDVRRAIGAAQICALLRGEKSESDAINDWIIKTNQYAKRQRTWFRTQFSADLVIDHIPGADDIKKILES
ncbi:MAG: tRNA (adenosine(37)-N6)-dimethylallyltransferase MiaA [Alphaproteobacteria bacterium]|nr:tRNA (adenosine(37)-N6)-dimethylallyltransferase MiaA [Alphaproteobacteria bacterium]